MSAETSLEPVNAGPSETLLAQLGRVPAAVPAVPPARADADRALAVCVLREALRFAMQDAARRGARVDVVCAFQPPDWYTVVDGEWEVLTVVAVKANLEAQAQQLVRGVVLEEGAVLGAVPVEVVAMPGAPGRVLVEQARGADMLVLGHRGRGGVASVVLGSVGLYCVFHAPCSVTIVQPTTVAEVVPAPAAAPSPAPA